MWLVQINVIWASSNTCGRTATINHREVVIDTSTTKKGEGLRFYLDRDEEAKKWLDIYQKKSSPKWYNAAMGTLGTSLMLYGLIRPGSFSEGHGSSNKLVLLSSGISVLIVNYLVLRVLRSRNETLLLRSIEEYNKRNLPKIYFYPFKDHLRGEQVSKDLGVSIGIIKEF